MALSDLFTGTGISDFLTNNKDNPAYQQAQTQLGNQGFINQAAMDAYRAQMGNVPQQQVAGIDPQRMAGINAQLAAAQGPIQQLMNQAQTGATQFQQGIVPGQQALQNIAGGQGAQFSGGTAQQFGNALMPGLQASQSILGGLASGQQSPQFNQQNATAYQNFMTPSLMGAQDALKNQANMAWNQGVANIGGVGGVRSAIGIHPGDTNARRAVEAGEISSYDDLAIRLDGDPVYRIIKASADIGGEGGVQSAIGVQPGDTIARRAVDGGENPSHEDLAIGLDGDRLSNRIETTAYIGGEGGVWAAWTGSPCT
jgi:hypothetical protein